MPQSMELANTPWQCLSGYPMRGLSGYSVGAGLLVRLLAKNERSQNLLSPKEPGKGSGRRRGTRSPHCGANIAQARPLRRNGRVAFVVDDLASIEPWRARDIENGATLSGLPERGSRAHAGAEARYATCYPPPTPRRRCTPCHRPRSPSLHSWVLCCCAPTTNSLQHELPLPHQ
jgi:hypothetical protein